MLLNLHHPIQQLVIFQTTTNTQLPEDIASNAAVNDPDNNNDNLSDETQLTTYRKQAYCDCLDNKSWHTQINLNRAYSLLGQIAQSITEKQQLSYPLALRLQLAIETLALAALSDRLNLNDNNPESPTAFNALKQLVTRNNLTLPPEISAISGLLFSNDSHLALPTNHGQAEFKKK